MTYSIASIQGGARQIIAGLFVGALASTSAQAQANLALNRPAWATTVDWSKLGAARAVDSDMDTFWSSALESNPWLEVNLQASYTVNRVKVQFPDSSPNPFIWKLQVLTDQGTWSDAYCEGSTTTAPGPAGVRDVTFPAVRGRNFRIYISTPGSWGIQIYDFELFEHTGAKFNLNSASLPSGGGTITRSPDNLNYTSGSTVTLTATPAANYRFTGWSGAASGSTNPLTVTMNAGKLVTANFASTTTTNLALKRPVTAYATAATSDTSGAVDGSVSTAWVGNTYDDNWLSVDLETNGTVSQAKVNFDTTNFPSEWRLQTLVNGSWVDLFSQTLTTGGWKTANIPAITARNFRIYMVFNSAQYTGIYQVNEVQLIGQTTTNYSLSTATNLSNSGTVTAPNGSGYAPGSVVALTATPAAGYTFTGWSGDASGTTSPLNLTMNGNKFVMANFASTTLYKLTTSVSGNGSIVRSPNATYYPNRSTVSLTATGGGNYWFFGWSGDVNTTSNPLNLTMTAATTTMATFTTATCGKPSAQVDVWSDGQELGFVQPYNNCYNYANNTRTDTFAQPGNWSGHLLTVDIMDCATTYAFAKADGLVPTTKTAALPYGRTRICLVIDPYFDFHWYRQNANGLWSHKPGRDVARDTDESGNLITDPETADRGIYKYVCGYFSICSSADPFTGHSTIQ